MMRTLAYARRVAGLSLLALAALLVLSAALAAPDAEARKKIKTVQCVVGQSCFGTDGRDRLLGTGSNDLLVSLGGADILRANGGDDASQGGAGSDLYTGYEGTFGSDLIKEAGGRADFLDLSSLSLVDDVSLVRDEDPSDLIIDGPGLNEVELDGQFTSSGRIEKLKFSDATISGFQVESLAREAAPGESLPEDEISIQRVE